jgi:hypothetical protein
MIDLVELFCHVDDFCQRFMPAYEKTLLEQQVKQPEFGIINLYNSMG